MNKWIAMIIAVVSPTVFAATASAAGYEEAAQTINALMRTHHYNPQELESDAYKRIEAATRALGASAASDEEFISGYNALWRGGPFSHVRLSKAQGSAAELAAHLDTLTLDEPGATLRWDGDTAFLTVTTMMGLNTIGEINAAYDEIAEKGAVRLIIDLRNNGGGAFAVLPLVAHVLEKPYDAGVFVAQKWNAGNDAPPTRDDALSVDPWAGWSILSFWNDVTENTLTRITFQPAEPVFEGPVYVLTSAKTASAAEMAADALKGSGRATLIGETTAGQMLSQSIFDVPGGFHLSLPIADYYSLSAGRIEGAGVSPHIASEGKNALAVAMKK